MDLVDGMKTFVAAVETGSFTAAADRVGISKKLVSKYVAQLENRLGVRLLHRTTRTLSMTDAGRRYFSRCGQLIEDLENLEAAVRNEDAGLAGTLRIAAPSSFGELFVVPLVRQFRLDHPELTIDLRLNDRYVDLAHEGVDLAIRIGALEDSGLISRRLTTTQLWAVAAPDFLKNFGEPSTPRALTEYECIRDTNLRSGQTWPFSTLGQMRGIAVSGRLLVNSATAVRELALSGVGIGLCPDYVVEEDVSEGRLKRILDDYPSVTLDIHAVFLSARAMPAKSRAFLEFIAQRFRRKSSWPGLAKAERGVP